MQIRRPLKRSCPKTDVRQKEERGGSSDIREVHTQLFFSRDFFYEVLAEVLPVLESTKQLLWIFCMFIHIETKKTDSYPSYGLKFNMQGVTEKVFEIYFLFLFSLPDSLRLWPLGRFCGRGLSKYEKNRSNSLTSRSNLPLSTFEDTFLLEITVLNVS